MAILIDWERVRAAIVLLLILTALVWGVVAAVGCSELHLHLHMERQPPEVTLEVLGEPPEPEVILEVVPA